MRTSTTTHPVPRSLARRRRLALLVAPAMALVIAVGCGKDADPSTETAVMGETVERASSGTLPAAGSRPRHVAESTDRAAPVDPTEVLRIGGSRIVAESTDRVRPVASGTVAGLRYSGQAEAYAADDSPSDGHQHGTRWADPSDD